MYDIVGDIHGHASLLRKLLKNLEYKRVNSTYRHPERIMIFTGDIINRGPEIKETIRIIRNMVDAGSAKMILGNHEFNAILYRTRDEFGKFFLPHSARYKMPLLKTLSNFTRNPDEWKDIVKWFRTQPLFLDLGEIRVVHAAWIDKKIAAIKEFHADDKIKKSFLSMYTKDAVFASSVNMTLKGQELVLPKDIIIKDSKGISHRKFRVQWWDDIENKTFREASFGNKFLLPPYTIPKEVSIPTFPYPEDAPILFFGHYCLQEGAQVIRPNLCCVDSCIAKTKSLSAYRWNGEKILTEKNIVVIR